ncbi:MAG TPA: hypothetical protein VIQ51_13090, partial [Chryseosolibacter sp.]
MKKLSLSILCVIFALHTQGQNVLTPEGLWQLGRVSAVGITPDAKQVIYRVSTPVIEENAAHVKVYTVLLAGGVPEEVANIEGLLRDKNISPDGKFRIDVREVKIQKVYGKDFYPDLAKSNVQIYD